MIKFRKKMIKFKKNRLNLNKMVRVKVEKKSEDQR